jgi:predicted naringenin-chalcone synthase
VPAYCIQLIAYWLRAKVTDLLPDLTCQGQIAIHVIHPSGRRVRASQPTRPSARASA